MEAGSLPLSVARFPDLPPTSPGPKSDSLRAQAEAFWGLGIFKGGSLVPAQHLSHGGALAEPRRKNLEIYRKLKAACVNNTLYASAISEGRVRNWTAHVHGTASSW